MLHRVLDGAEHAPLILVSDSIRQSGRGMLRELVRRAAGDARSVMCITTERQAARHLDAISLAKGVTWIGYGAFHGLAPDAATVASIGELSRVFSSLIDFNVPTLVVVDTINALLTDDSRGTLRFLASLRVSHPKVSVVALLHRDMPPRPSATSTAHQPDALLALEHLATTRIAIHNAQDEETQRERLVRGAFDGGSGCAPGLVVSAPSTRLPLWCNFAHRHRGKVSRIQRGIFIIYYEDSDNESIRIAEKTASALAPEPAAIAPSTTTPLVPVSSFNLATSETQSLARSQVPLPYISAQTGTDGNAGQGLIHYEADEADDFDEEDPDDDLAI